MDRVARRGPLVRAPGALKGGHFRNCQHFCRSWGGFVAKHQKIEGEKNFYFREKISQCRKKLKGGTLWDFPTSILSQNSKKIEGGPFGRKKIPEKKSRSAEKNWKGDPLVSPGMVCYAGKQEKHFWFISLDQIVHFGAIIFCRTFVELFCSVDWKKKKSHYNSRVSLHEAPTKIRTRVTFSLVRFCMLRWKIGPWNFCGTCLSILVSSSGLKKPSKT